ncbi:MAG: chemotaxis protein CheA [Lachnospiraceae bacterium]|nr:chemotaxis protein CheA [Lachnospiraceae bacterium]MBR1875941.1 chemotaxis protein CheA [Lachnospiraceae bacterium]
MDVSQYLGIFLDEAKEHIQVLSDQMLILEQEPDNQDAINEIFRAAHSLKGMAGTMGYKRLQRLTHDMEDCFSAVRAGQLTVTSEMMDVLFQALDAIEGYVDTIQNTSDEGDNDNDSIVNELNRILKGEAAGSGDAGEAKKEEEKKEEAAASASQSAPDDDKAIYKTIELDDTQRNVMKDAIVSGKHVYGFTVYIQESCLLKAARAFLVFKAIEEAGEVVVSSPSSQDIEDEKFEFNFSLFAISDDDFDKVKTAILSVSEIEEAVGEEYNEEMLDESSKEEAPVQESEAAEEKPVENAPVPVSAPAAKESPAAAAKKPAGKPVVSRTIRVDIEKLDTLMNLVSELIIAKNTIVSAAQTGQASGNNAIVENVEYLESVTTNLHEAVMKVRMVPIESAVQKFPRMVRDLEKKLDKKMNLTITGEETELDRTVVDEIGDPLMHLIRNSADHGLENTATRIERGKPETGTIFLNAYQDGNNVVIEVGDDGNGIDVEAVRSKIIERGYASEETANQMSDKDIINVLFDPGFSMAKQVTDISGRGVGLDVVKSNIESLGGDVEVKTKLGEGSTFIVRLPLTLAIIQALMVIVGGEKYAISLDSIQTIEDIPVSDIKLVQQKEVIQLRGTVIPIIRLSDVLGVESSRAENENLVVVIVKKGDTQAGLVVDELMGQQEIVIKSLGKYINCDRIISGATILGDGEVALIVDANALI